MKTTSAKKVLIVKLMRGFPSSQSQITEGTVDEYAEALAECSVEAVAEACRRFVRGEIAGRNNAFVPSVAELVTQARYWDDVSGRVRANVALDGLVSYRIGEKPPPPKVAGGILKLEVGGRMTDVSKWTNAEQDEAIRTGKTPASVTARLAGADPDKIAGTVKPQLRKM